jgi:hypothetical protein
MRGGANACTTDTFQRTLPGYSYVSTQFRLKAPRAPAHFAVAFWTAQPTRYLQPKTVREMVLALALVCSQHAVAENGVTRDSILLGQSVALTGGAAQLGIQMRNGLKAYFDYVNEHGGVNGRKLELVTLDDGGKDGCGPRRLLRHLFTEQPRGLEVRRPDEHHSRRQVHALKEHFSGLTLRSWHPAKWLRRRRRDKLPIPQFHGWAPS